VTIVMGLDQQHRGRITGEWIDTDTGEVQRTRVAPADRAAVGTRWPPASCAQIRPTHSIRQLDDPGAVVVS